MEIKKSKELFRQAKQYIPGGVNSPVRAFGSVGGDPLFVKSAKGPYIYDEDGNEFIDYVGSWGPHLFGNNPGFIREALSEAMKDGTSFGAPTAKEVKMAELICSLVPSIEMVRMVNSGTEATMSAVRLARGYTGRDKFIKFEGCYHGHGDSFLIKAGSGALTFGVPTSPGVTKATAADTLLAEYNNINSVKDIIRENKGEIAALIIEPIAGNMGVVPADREFLLQLKEVCANEGIVLIFDEVMSGFRVAAGGAQEIYGIDADLVTFGKVIGGGMPVGAFGGKKEIMEKISPLGSIYQAGTLSGNPLAMSAGIAMLEYIKDHPDIYSFIEEKAAYLESGMKDAVRSKAGKNFTMNRVGSMSCMFFTEGEVIDFRGAVSSDTKMYAKYFHAMLDRGIWLAPSQFEAMFVSTEHHLTDLDRTLEAFEQAISSIF